jgi:hypothetical protein
VARRWTDVDDERLARGYADGEPLANIAAELHRSVDALVARRNLLGIPPRHRARPWTTLEDRFLRAAADRRIPASVLAGRLDRAVGQVRARQRRLGLPPATPGRPYTEADETMLREGWDAGVGLDELARRMRRSPGALRARAEALGLHHPPRRARWTAAEDDRLRTGYARGLTCRRIAADLPGRTSGAVAARARKLGLSTYGRSWTAHDEARLRQLASTCSVSELADTLSRTPAAIRRRARRLGLTIGVDPSPPRAGAHWTAAEDAFLRHHAGASPAVLGMRLGRTDLAVVSRLSQLGLREGRHRSPHHPAPARAGLTPGEHRLVARELAHPGGRRLLALAERLDRSPGSLLKAAGQAR